jgi:glucose/arabinose dehydrogenase/plastocyanin
MSSRHLVWVVLLAVAACALLAGCATQPPGQNITTTPTPAPTSTVTVTATGTPAGNVTDLTNRDSPEIANFTTYPSTTRLHTPAARIGLERVIGNLTSPLFVASPDDGSGRHVVVDQNGYATLFYLNGSVVNRPFLDLRGKLVRLDPTYDERGLLSIAFHPNFSENGKVYAYYSAPLRAGADPAWSCTNHLSEFTVNRSNPNEVDNATERVLLTVDKPYQNHNGGILLFGPDDGYLYLTLGDGGRADDTGMGHIPGTGNAQNLTTILGKIIRIDVDSTVGPTWTPAGNATWTSGAGSLYGIPADNPFLSNTGIPPEIYAYGFRNPAFASFDSGGSNRMFIAMAGQRLFESVLILYRGGAYPWNIREGTHCFDPANDFQIPNNTCRITSYYGEPLIGPVVELGHDVGDTIVGGVVYRGGNLTGLQGAYLFGTWSDESRLVGNGTLLAASPPAGLDTSSLPEAAADLTAAQNAMWTTSELAVANNANGRINAFVRGLYETADHEALVLINQNGGPGITPQNSGEVWRIVPPGTPGLVAIGNTSATGGTGGGGATATGTARATATATATPTTGATSTTGAAGAAAQVAITAKNLAFDRTTITVPRGSSVTVTFNNQDAGVPHNVAFYTDSSASTAIYKGQVVTGPTTTTYTFTAPSAPGTYFFRCDVHPETMTGSFIVT